MSKRILFFSCEAGGAEVLIPVINLLRRKSFEIEVTGYGYAIQRFKDKQIPFTEIPRIEQNSFKLFETFRPDLIISSATSLPYKDMSEKYLWENAEKSNIKTIAFLDQWQNYSIRFSGINHHEKLKYLPTFINCINEAGKAEMINEGFDKSVLFSFGHPYLSTLHDDAKQIDIPLLKKSLNIKNGQKIFLFVSEAIKENYGENYGYNQYQVLNFFLENIKDVSEATVIIKLHPKDDINNFKNIILRFSALNLILIANELPPLKCILISDFVYGMASIMLIEAYILGKKVVSLQPNLKVNDPLLISRINLISKITTYDRFDVLKISHSKNEPFEIEFLEDKFLTFVNNLLST